MQEIISLDEREYFYLDEHFDIMSPDDVSNLPGYIVLRRQEKIRMLFELAVETELTDSQREYILDRYVRGMNISAIAAAHSVTRQSVYRVLAAAEKRLFDVLKYAYVCGFNLLEAPDSLQEIITKIGKENLLENNHDTRNAR